MTISWNDYVRWAHESGNRKTGPDTPEAERAALFKIWSLGLGEELLEFIAEVSDWSDPLYSRSSNGAGSRVVVLREVGDALFYLARMYRDTGNERRPTDRAFDGSLRSMAKHVGAVVGCAKKAYRAEGDKGLVRLSFFEAEVHYATEKGVFKGRRAEFGRLLDLALDAIETWLVEQGSSLSEACELNVEKLVKRRQEGLISAQGERVSELGRAVRPEDLPLVLVNEVNAAVEGFRALIKGDQDELPSPRRSG